MIGYTEVLQVIGAMIIFSLILTTANRYMLGNVEAKITSEVEVHAVTIAQDMIELSKSLPFDAATSGSNIPGDIPDDFVNADPVPANNNSNNRNSLQHFEDFNGYSEDITTGLGIFSISTEVSYMDPNNLDQTFSQKSIYKRITVTVSSPSLRNDVALNYTRVYNNSN
ncbi:MAG: hypothetical protein JJU46_13790 [Balneolaceae bacterium]|nr:hypothetical protein [Balneolaceae bacterium]MCH8548121.1 hypothetical protein [Balneolaceae bacterium]